MRTDGWITIGTKLDNNQFDRDISNLEKQIKKEEQKSQLKFEISQQAKNDLEKHGQKLDDLAEKYDTLFEARRRYEKISEKLSGKTELEPLEYIQLSAELPDLEAMLSDKSGEFGKFNKIQDQLAKAVSQQENLELKVEKTNLEYENSINKIKELKSKINQVEIKRVENSVENIKDNFKNSISSVEKIGKSVTRTLLSLFGIRSIMAILSRASSQLKSYDKEYAANIDYIQFALVQVIAPVLKYIVNLMGTLLQYVNYIAQAWFGINIFTNASVNDFQKMKNSAEGIKKALQTTPFDEMNILGDTQGTSSASAAIPNFDLSEMVGEVPEWLQWIVDHKNEVINGLIGIAAGLVAIKLGIDPLKALGIGVALFGILETIRSLKDYLDDASFKNFGNIIKSIGVAIVGVGVAIASIPTIVTGAVLLIVGIVVKYWEQIRETLQNGLDWLKDKSDWVSRYLGQSVGFIYNTIITFLQMLLDDWDNNINTWKKVFDGFIEFIQGVFTGDWERAWEGIKTIATAIIDAIGTHFSNMFNAIKGTFVNFVNTIIGGFNNIVETANKIGSAFGIELPKIPMLQLSETGAIVGVPVGNGIPTNNNQGTSITDRALNDMAEIIGKNVVVNANITNSMNGRVISRVLEQVRNEREFAMNN